MLNELLARAWERNGPWVARRYGLTEADVERLREVGVLPLPSGDVVLTPQAILRIWEELAELRRAVERRRRGSAEE